MAIATFSVMSIGPCFIIILGFCDLVTTSHGTFAHIHCCLYMHDNNIIITLYKSRKHMCIIAFQQSNTRNRYGTTIVKGVALRDYNL